MKQQRDSPATKFFKRSSLMVFTAFFCLQYSIAQGQHETIYFKKDSYSVSKNYYTILNEIARKCSSDSFAYLRIFAYTDTSGSEEYNDALSMNRAMTVYNYLHSHSKFDTTKVYVTWLGESDDGYDLHVPVAHLQLRCVDIWVSFFKRKNKPNDLK